MYVLGNSSLCPLTISLEASIWKSIPPPSTPPPRLKQQHQSLRRRSSDQSLATQSKPNQHGLKPSFSFHNSIVLYIGVFPTMRRKKKVPRCISVGRYTTQSKISYFILGGGGGGVYRGRGEEVPFSAHTPLTLTGMFSPLSLYPVSVTTLSPLSRPSPLPPPR